MALLSKEQTDALKESLTIEEVEALMVDLGAEPVKTHNVLICKTVCHCGDHHKLYYYENTHLFRCYTDCADTFDIFELIIKVMTNNGHYKEINGEKVQWTLYDAIKFITRYFNISLPSIDDDSFGYDLEDWKILEKYEKQQEIPHIKQHDLVFYDDAILQHLPQPIIEPWVEEGITTEVMQHCGIRFDPVNCGIIIPHRDMDNNLLGIRIRTLIQEEEKYGKYRPAFLNGQLYNHPLSFNLYNLNNSKENIKNFGIAIVFESEKSPLLYQSYFGIENDISVAVCGFNILSYQVELLIAAGAKEIALAFDKQFQSIGDAEWEKLKEKYYTIHNKYGGIIQLSFLFDFDNLLQYKDAPIDRGPQVFLQLFQNRIMI